MTDFKLDDIVIRNSYATADKCIFAHDMKVIDGKLNILIDSEFIIIPVEMFGVQQWYSKLIQIIVNDLQKLALNTKLSAEEYNDAIRKILYKIYEKPNTDNDVPHNVKL